jgi:hypothetical protein
MVKLYPTLIANSVSKNIIPGILKSIERYAMIYRMGDIMKQARKDIPGVESIYSKKVGARIKVVMKETDEQVAEFLAKEFLTEQGPTSRYGPGTKQPKWSVVSEPPDPGNGPHGQGQSQAQSIRQSQRQSQRQGREEDNFKRDPEEERELAYKKEVEKQRAIQQARAANASIGVGPYDMTALGLEPSWMRIDMETPDGAKHSGVIGVKAVAIAVKSDAKLSHLIMWDKQIGKLMMLIIRLGRPIEGLFYRLWKRSVGKFFGTTSVTGDPYKDIIMKRTILSTSQAEDVFLVLNQSDISPDFLSSAGGVKKLFKLGWQSFCIADDVNRRVAFCMKQFKGMCSIIPYTMLYQTLGQARVFEDMEDLRRSSGALFKTKKTLKLTLGESIAQTKLDEFSVDLFPVSPLETQRDIEILQEIEMLDESFGSFVKKVMSGPKQVLSRAIKGTIKAPDVGPDRMAMLGNKINPGFKKSYDLALKVLENSITDIKDASVVKWTALLVAIKSIAGKGDNDLMSETREQLKKLIPLLRKGMRKIISKTSYKTKPPPSHWPEVFIGSVVLMSLTTVAYKIFELAENIGLVKVAGAALKAQWEAVKLVLSGIKALYSKLYYADAKEIKGIADEYAGDFKATLEAASDTWIILAFAIVGIIFSFKLLKRKVIGGKE